MVAAAGWYADPWGRAALRWWDGVQWTASTQAAPTASSHPQDAVGDVADHRNHRSPSVGDPLESLGEADDRSPSRRLVDKPPWERSKFERGASGAGIAFERRDAVPDGKALLACDPWAACVIMSERTANGLDLQDDSALWGAIARHHGAPEPVLVSLPSFGGGTVESISPTDVLHALASYATARAKSYTPAEDEHCAEEDCDHYECDGCAYTPAEFWIDHLPYYRRFLKEHAPRIVWLDQLRANLEADLLREVVCANDSERPQRCLRMVSYLAMRPSLGA